MARIEKTVFISYRRVNRWVALAVFKDLTQHGYDVFVDYDGIASGDFERAIIDNIWARAHFVLLLTPVALERCDDPSDWLRREIETALESKRNIVPLLFDGFTFQAPIATQRLQGSLAPLRRYQALEVPDNYFDDAMSRLRNKYLAVAVETVVHTASKHAQQIAEEQNVAASMATAHAHSNKDAIVRPVPLAAPQRAQATTAAALTIEGQAAGDLEPENAERKASGISTRLMAVIALAALIAGIAVFVSGGRKEVAPPSTSEGLSSGSISSRPADGPTDAAAQNALADDYFFGRNGRTQDDVEASKWYRKAAEQGNAAAQAYLGLMYELGRGGLRKDEVEAVKWYRKAAEQGNALGQGYLGVMYQNGRGGLSKDDVEASKWYRKGAEQGNAAAQAYLGVMYERGRGGLAKDDVEAVKWYHKAAEQGNASGQASFGFMYQNGRGGLAKDDVEAVKWYRKAAEQGNASGQANLGVMYQNGFGGLTKDDVEAVKWYRKAAEQGNASGQAYLGAMYELGRGGLRKDEVEAVKWYRKAAEQGNPYAKDELKRLGKI